VTATPHGFLNWPSPLSLSPDLQMATPVWKLVIVARQWPDSLKRRERELHNIPDLKRHHQHVILTCDVPDQAPSHPGSRQREVQRWPAFCKPQLLHCLLGR
jgi:hypothetical protein